MDLGICNELSERALDEGLYATGYMLLQEEKWAEAASVLRLLLVRDPQNPRSWLALGACHEGVDDYEGAVSLYEKGLMACEDNQTSLESAIERANSEGGIS